MIDTHSHMYSEQFNGDRPEALLRAKAEGVEFILLPNIDEESIDALHSLSDAEKNCLPMMGLHPCSVNEDVNKKLLLVENELFQGVRKYIAVGEIGIDLYWDRSHIEAQKEAFRIQISWAKTLGLPIVIHARDSMAEILEILDEEHAEDLSGVFHCFSGNDADARRILSYKSFMFGIGGVVTFKNSKLPQVLAGIPLNKILLETDAPYLAPVPFRGKRNESAYLSYVAEKLSDIYECSIDIIKEKTTANAERLFQITKFTAS
jgi:TatD DNase family protein